LAPAGINDDGEEPEAPKKIMDPLKEQNDR